MPKTTYYGTSSAVEVQFFAIFMISFQDTTTLKTKFPVLADIHQDTNNLRVLSDIHIEPGTNQETLKLWPPN